MGSWGLAPGVLDLAINGLYADGRVGAEVGPWQRLGGVPSLQVAQAEPGMLGKGM